MRKGIRIIAAIIFIAFCFSACIGSSYGTQFGTMDELRQDMEKNDLTMHYPTDFTAEENATYNFVSQIDTGSKSAEGYKIYRFGSPFYVSVCAYRGTSDIVQSDTPERLEKLETIESTRGNIEIYAGKGYEDALFLIGLINIDGNHYECRVTADKERKDDAYVNSIYRDNDAYHQAIKEIQTVFESLE